MRDDKVDVARYDALHSGTVLWSRRFPALLMRILDAWLPHVFSVARASRSRLWLSVRVAGNSTHGRQGIKAVTQVSRVLSMPILPQEACNIAGA